MNDKSPEYKQTIVRGASRYTLTIYQYGPARWGLSRKDENLETGQGGSRSWWVETREAVDQAIREFEEGPVLA